MDELNNFLGGRTKPTVRAEVGVDTQSLMITMGIIVVAGVTLILFYRLITMSDRK